MISHPRHRAGLDALAARDRLRARTPAVGLDFASNDYLGLAGSELLNQAALDALNRGVPVGAAGSRLLRGNHPEHEALEEEAAAFFGAEAALFIGGGFQANHALFAALPMQGDLVLYDALIHASAHDGMRLGRAETRPFAHNDVEAAGAEIQSWRAEGGSGRVWLAVESLYSMEGDLAPLDQLAALARRHDAIRVVDEAHATGLFGPTGAGRALTQPHDPNLLTLHTCGKGLGAVGALICGDAVLIETLVNKARPFIFATAPSPLDAAIVRAALAALRDRPDLRDRAWTRIAHAHAEARRLCGLDGFDSQILPIPIGADGEAVALARALQTRGYDVRAVRPPTVPKGTARLRISLTGAADQAAVTGLFETLSDVGSAYL
ncbi:MAG: 8-amino-7-oxononanoate synthase [Brevundimonas sp.]